MTIFHNYFNHQGYLLDKITAQISVKDIHCVLEKKSAQQASFYMNFIRSIRQTTNICFQRIFFQS